MYLIYHARSGGFLFLLFFFWLRRISKLKLQGIAQLTYICTENYSFILKLYNSKNQILLKIKNYVLKCHLKGLLKIRSKEIWNYKHTQGIYLKSINGNIIWRKSMKNCIIINDSLYFKNQTGKNYKMILLKMILYKWNFKFK